MRVILALGIFFCCCTTLWAGPVDKEFHESLDEFEKEFNILENSEEEAKEKEVLEEAEKEINEQNKKYADGEGKFYEKLYEFSDLPNGLFETEKTGLVVEATRAFGLNPMTAEESRMWEERTSGVMDTAFAKDISQFPGTFDARTAGYVTAVKDQKQCGSCAAFTSAGNMEACMLKAGAKKDGLDLSEQYLIDCFYDGKYVKGCHGATLVHYPYYTKEKKGGHVAHEFKYPYLNTDPKLTCPSADTVPLWSSGAKVVEVGYKQLCSVEQLKKLVNEFGAVSVGVNGNSTHFRNYAGGILNTCGSLLNHAVLIVGYGTDHWIIKNSWGANWGENGFAKIAMDNNMCGIQGECVVTKCEAANPDVTPTPPPPPPPPAPEMYCNVSGWFGPITGNYDIRISVNNVIYDSKLTCQSGVCTPREAGPTNACVYICGQTKCGS